MTVYKTDWDPERAERWAEDHGVEIDQSINLCDQGFTVIAMGGDPIAMATVTKAGNACFFENFLTAPSLTVKEARCCALILERAARNWARNNDCVRLVALVQSKGVMREVQKLGFEQQGSPMAFMTKEI